ALRKNNYVSSVATSSANGYHKLIVKVTNKNTGCYSTKEIELKVVPSGITTYPDIYVSELDKNADNVSSPNSVGSGNSFYDFSKKTNEISTNSSGALNTTTYNFKYYRTRLEATLETNEIVAPFNDDLFTDNKDVFVRISLKTSGTCESIGQFKIRILKRPVPQGNTNNIFLCLNNPIDNPQLRFVDLDANTGNNADTYQWYLNGQLIPNETNAILKTTKEGTYKVKAFRTYLNNPSTTSDDVTSIGYNTFTVKESNIALVDTINFKDDRDTPSENTITVKVTGIGKYEYALNSNNNGDFKKGTDNLSYTFTNVPMGLNKVYIRDANGCGIVNTKEVSFIYFQRHFSPNGDGKFDTWQILGADTSFYTQINLQIFDRYGRLLKKINQKKENGWNGTFNGKLLPSNDYWYNAVLVDIKGNVRKKTGHFALIRK
ncbi:MAG: T9SS type B sorting domain-containing protein, partial [Polaribacter sp.]